MGWKGLTAFALCGAISRPPTEKFAVRYTLAHRVAPVGEEPPLGAVDAAGVVGQEASRASATPWSAAAGGRGTIWSLAVVVMEDLQGLPTAQEIVGFSR